MAYWRTVYLTSGSTWTVPYSWNSTQNYVICWGGGASGGGRGATTGAGGGGGGGGNSIKNNIQLTIGSSVSYSVGAAGGSAGVNNGVDGGDTWFISTDTVLAKGGKAGLAAGNGGQGGQASEGVGDTKYSGGNGGNGSSTAGRGGAGGGGAGGTEGNGSNGSNSASTTGANGGTGGNPGGGAGGIGSAAGANGGVGSNGGAGGGGGGSGGLSSDAYGTYYWNGGAGGYWGAGGGGGGNGGAGQQGLIAIAWYDKSDGFPASGPIKMTDINLVTFGDNVDPRLQRNLNNSDIRAILNSPTNASKIAMSQAYNKSSVYRFAWVPRTSGDYYSGTGSGVQTPQFNVKTFFPGIQTGQAFYIDSNQEGNWTQPGQNSMRHLLVYGTPISGYWSFDGQSGRKNNYYQVYYNGTDNFYIYGYYAGDSTNFPLLNIALRRVQFLGFGSYTPQLIDMNMDYTTYANNIYSYQGQIRI